MMNRLAAVMVVMVMGLTAFGAKAATGTDNLEIEVRVSIIGTVDLTLANSTGTGITVGPGSSSATPNTDADFANDKVTWAIANPDLGQSYQTDGSILLDNIGKKKVTVTAQVLGANADTATTGGKWTMAAAPAVSIYSLGIKVAATGLPANSPSIDPAVAGAAYAPFGTATPAVGGPTPVAAVDSTLLTLVTSFKKQHAPVKIDLEYSTPTDITNNNEFDNTHIHTITLAGAAD